MQTCTLVDLPITSTATINATARPVATNAGDGRVYVIAVDAFHMTPAGAHRVTPILEQFITHYMGPADLAAVVRLDYAPRGSEFTSDKGRLLSLVGSEIAPAASMAPPMAEFGGARAAPAALLNERLLGSLAAAMQYAARPQGRRTSVLLVSEGLDTDIFTAARGNDEALRTLEAQREAIEAAVRANVRIYAIDPRGLSAIAPRVATNSGGRPPGLRKWDSLRTLAGETGGRAIVGRMDLRDPFRQLVEENSTYYILGYVSPHADDRDGKFHEVTVRVQRSNARVEARRGWYAPKRRQGKTERALSAAWSDSSLENLLARPLPTGNLGLTLRATGAPVRLEEKRAAVAIVVEGHASELSWRPVAGGMEARLELAYRTIADDGKELKADPQIVALRRRSPRSSGEDVWRYVGEVMLRPGHSQVRIAAHAPDSDRGGSVFLDVDVPDPHDAPLALGDLLVTSRLASMPTSGAAPDIDRVLPGPPTTVRTFTRDDTLAVYVHLAGKRAGSATVRGVLRAGNGELELRTIDPERQEAADDAANYVATLPLTSLDPDDYLLTFEATAPKADAVSRSVAFTVR